MPQEPSLDVVGIGNAIVDVLTHSDDAFLERHGLMKGIMRLVDEREASAIYADMGAAVECSGGSAANTMAGIAALGARAAYIGKVRDDELGDIFRHDIRALGVGFDVPPAAEGPTTGRCLVLVTPDAHRTMCTFLGVSVDLGPEDVDDELVAAAAVVYLEGYMWDAPRAKAAFRRAMEVARAAGRKVSLTLSDPFCVERHRAEFRELVRDHVDILFANEHEIASLYECDDLATAIDLVRAECEIAVLTRSDKGSVVVNGDETHTVDAEPVDEVVDTTGAGDLYAAGFLWAYTRGMDLPACARAGGVAAADVISHFGARPGDDLAALMAEAVTA